MNPDRDQTRKDQPQKQHPEKEQQEKPRSSAFKETSRGDKKSTINIEEEADLEKKNKDNLAGGD